MSLDFGVGAVHPGQHIMQTVVALNKIQCCTMMPVQPLLLKLYVYVKLSVCRIEAEIYNNT